MTPESYCLRRLPGLSDFKKRKSQRLGVIIIPLCLYLNKSFTFLSELQLKKDSPDMEMDRDTAESLSKRLCHREGGGFQPFKDIIQ